MVVGRWKRQDGKRRKNGSWAKGERVEQKGRERRKVGRESKEWMRRKRKGCGFPATMERRW